MDACRELIWGDGSDECVQRVIDIARFAVGADPETPAVNALCREARQRARGIGR
jgi:hypothetical protein